MHETTKTDDNDFSRIVREHSRLIFTVCYRLVHDYQEAENLTQETFLTAYRAIGRFQGTNYKPWLIRIAANKAKDWLKSAYHATTEPAGPEELAGFAAPSAYDDLEAQETRREVEAACESLPEPYREVARLRFLEDRTSEEIAGRLGRPLKTVQTQGHRAREKLRTLLKEELP